MSGSWNRQQDAADFLTKILEQDPSGIKKSLKNPYASLGQDFVIDLKEVIQCGNNPNDKKHRKVVDEPSTGIDVRIEGNRDGVQQYLEDYFALSEDIDNWSGCKACKGEVSAKKFPRINNAPKILRINLKRFDYDKAAENTIKINKKVSFDGNLTVKKDWFLDPSNAADVEYSLVGVIIHSGSSANSGHYWCYCKNDKGQWFKYDDRGVSEIEFKDFKDEAFGSGHGVSAYVLFYKKVE